MDTPSGPTRPPSRLPRAAALCVLASVLLGAFTQWPVWACVAVAVVGSALLSGLIGAHVRGFPRPAGDPGA